MPNPKYLDPSLNQQRILDGPTSYWTIRQYLNCMQWVGIELSSTQPLAPHVICMKWKMGSSADEIPNPTHSPISHLPLSLKEQEQGRTRERKWRLEMKVEDEVKTCNPRPSSHQAQLILISRSWLAHELPSWLFGIFSQTLISIFHACMDHGVSLLEISTSMTNRFHH